MRLRASGHDFELRTVEYEFNKHTFIVRSLLTARSSYASAVMGIVILSVCPSVRHTRAL